MADEPSQTMTHPARELTEEEIAVRRDECFLIEQTIKDCIQQGRAAMWQLSKSMYEFNEENGWTALGYESQGEWLAQPEIGMSKRTFHRMVRIYRETVIERSVSMETMEELEQSKVEIVLPAVEQETITMEEALEDARTLGVIDLRERYIGPQKAAKKADENGGDTATEEKPKKGKKAEPEDLPEWTVAALTVDSWVDLGGDKRKAMRNWKKFTTTHPVYSSTALINAYLEGEEVNGEQITKEQMQGAWLTLREALSLQLD